MRVSSNVFKYMPTIDPYIIRSPRNLINIPHIVSFFLNFVIRNRAVPEHEQGLRRAVALVQLAKKELPFTSAIGKLLPGDFSKGCEGLWGRSSCTADMQTLLDSKDQVPEFKPERRAANSETIHPVNLFNEAFEDNVGDDVNLAVNATGWGGSWNAGEAKEAGESPGNWDSNASKPWGETSDSWNLPDVSGWEDPALSLLRMLGPTALPLTHTTGVVEWSVRRVKSVTPPPSSQPRIPSAKIPGEPDPLAVEAELERRFAKAVLEPWLNWDVTQELEPSHPKILPKSRGAVVIDDKVEGIGKAHDMLKDEITVLVPPSAVDVLCVGMGLGATWIEIARQTHKETRAGGNKKKVKKATERYWYMEQLMSILPSYYTA